MQTKQYRNRHFHLSLTTDSDYLFQAVDDILDFDAVEETNQSLLSISIEIREMLYTDNNDQEKYAYEHRLIDANRLSGWIGHPLCHIFTDPTHYAIRGKISPLFKSQEFSNERLLDIAFFQPMRYILSYHGYFFVHASVTHNSQNSILITGPQNAGKSTFAISLLQHGYHCVCACVSAAG